LAGAQLRTLRLAASAAAYGVVSGIIERIQKLRTQLNSLHRQQSSGTADPASKLGSALVGRSATIAEHISLLEQLAAKIFRGVFVFRYRDSCPAVRELSVTALGEWATREPETYMRDSYVKYVGWMLSDKVSQVRKCALMVILNFLKKDEHFPKLELFIKRFLPRFLQMVDDTDDSVVVVAVRVCGILVPRKLLAADDLSVFFSLLLDIAAQGGHAAGG